MASVAQRRGGRSRAIAWLAGWVALAACGANERAPTAPSVATGSGASLDGGSAGGGSEADAEKVMSGMLADLHRCYESGLARDATIAGKVVVAAAIDATGTVTSAMQDGGTTLPPDVVACIAARVRRARFPPPGEGGTTLRIPLSFKPE